MNKKDLMTGIASGVLIGLLVQPIISNLTSASLLMRIAAFAFFALGTPVGLFVAYYLGKKIPLIWQVGKFGVVGVLNTLVDLGVLNLLILTTGLFSGAGYSILKGCSFTAAVINSYFWNKYWTFDAEKKIQKPFVLGKEFLEFLIISLIGFGINVLTASLVVNVIGPQGGINSHAWANIGALTASVVGFAWNFIGYKFIVFKK